jgi:hypothetical protein
MKMMQEMKAQMNVLIELGARQAEQNNKLQLQMEEQAQLLASTMQSVRMVQSQVTGMRNELIDVCRGHAPGLESQALRRHLEARRGDSSAGVCASPTQAGEKEKARVNSPTMPEVTLPATADKAVTPPSSPCPAPSLPPSAVTGGLGVFAAVDEQASFSFSRSPPGLSLFSESLIQQGGSTPPREKNKERDEVVDFNELTSLIISGDEKYLEVIQNTSPEALNKADQDGMTAFHYAAMHGRARACDAILSQPGFNMTKVGDRNSNTAMHFATLHDQGDVCHVILKHDASAAKVVNHFGDTPCDIARRRGHPRVCAAFNN